jgi:cell wall-associated NlpC family hydrolase
VPSSLLHRGLAAGVVLSLISVGCPATGTPAAAAPPPAESRTALSPTTHAATRAAAQSPVTHPATAGRSLRSDRPSTAELDRRIAAAARRLEVIVEQYNGSREDLRAIQSQQRTLGARLMPMTVDLRRREALIGGLAARTYQRTRSGPTVALITSDSPREFVDGLLMLNRFAVEQQRAVAELDRARAQVRDTRRRIAELTARHRLQQERLTLQKAMVEGEIAALKQMRQVAYGGGSRYAKVFDHPAPPYVPGPAGRVVAFAFAQLGKPYRWAAAGPDSYDCSGLTQAAWRTAGAHLPHNAAAQYGTTARVDRSRLRPGDLVFFYRPVTHVGIYIGNGDMIHAPEFGEDVRVAPIDSQPIRGFGRPR